MNIQLLEDIIERFDPQIDRNLMVTQEEYTQRWNSVQKVMEERGYDLAYACGSELDRSDIAWLAGVFDPIIERYGILIPQKGTPVAVAGSEGGHVVEDCLETSGAELTLLQEFQISDEDYRFAEFEKLEDVVSRMVPVKAGQPLRVALLSSSQFIPYDHVTLFTGLCGGENVVFDVEFLQKIKYEKSFKELKLIQTANRIADAAFLGMLSVLKPDVRELDVAAAGDYIMKGLGARRTGFPTIVSSGNRGRTVLGPATNRVIRKGEFVSMGLSPTFNGYHGIMRRTVKVGTDWNESEKRFMQALEGLYHEVFKAVQETAEKDLASNHIDRKGKKYLDQTQLKDSKGRMTTPREPYTFIHNTGCSECQEGFGAVTPYTENRLAQNAALMIDVAFMGFDDKGDLVFPVEYAVIEDSFWKKGKQVGVYNQMPLCVQDFVGQGLTKVPEHKINPYHQELKEGL